MFAAERTPERCARAAAPPRAPGPGVAVPGPRLAACAAANCNAASRRRRSDRAANEQAVEGVCSRSWARSTIAAAQAGLQTALALKLEREQMRGPRSAASTTTSRRCASRRATRLTWSAASSRCASGSASCSSRPRRRNWAARSTWSSSPPPGRPGALAANIAEHNVKLGACRARSTASTREIAALGAVNLAALDELTTARERKDLPRRAERRPAGGHPHAGGRDPQDRPRDARPAGQDLQPGQRGTSAACSPAVRRRHGQAGDDRRRDPRCRRAGDGAAAGQEEPTIHLLSGGEKALTAIALVFAIFQLNPAPFCLLDEVDAPLTTRQHRALCPAGVEMSTKGTQFLFISHNKIAMEMAEQLIGVTMQERGRLAHRGGRHGCRHRHGRGPDPRGAGNTA